MYPYSKLHFLSNQSFFKSFLNFPLSFLLWFTSMPTHFSSSKTNWLIKSSRYQEIAWYVALTVNLLDFPISFQGSQYWEKITPSVLCLMTGLYKILDNLGNIPLKIGSSFKRWKQFVSIYNYFLPARKGQLVHETLSDKTQDSWEINFVKDEDSVLVLFSSGHLGCQNSLPT